LSNPLKRTQAFRPGKKFYYLPEKSPGLVPGFFVLWKEASSKEKLG
jgi:hypothetical protein